ncbi:cytochrome P450 4C1-like [Chrysoperla carnea]|uniref:cytochrome P450 4C1-like n=1 Tax=Chrysoperla carnea TaxID=189513 RepID=UPI001D05FEFA|nr:cytochrome P450 4C1-like [Chrysoperla carnea]
MGVEILYPLVYSFLITFLIAYYWKRRHLYIASFKIDGPISFPLIGNSYLFFGRSQEDVFSKSMEMIQSYSSTCRFWRGSQLLICIKNIKDIEKLLSSHKTTQKMYAYDLVKYSFGEGLFLSSGAVYRNSHRLIQPTFHHDVLETYIQLFQKNGDFLVESLRENVGKEAFDIFRKVNLCIIKNVVDTLMDTKMTPEITDELYFSLNRLYNIIHERLFKPWLHPEFIFKLTSIGKEERKSAKYLQDFIRNVIKSKKMELSLASDDSEYASNSKRRSTLDFLLRKLNENPNVMSEELLVDNISTIFLAAQDATSIQYSFAVLMFGMYPNLQDKIYEEIQKVLGQESTFTISDLNELVYLDMFLNECLRLLPIPFIGRKVTEDLQFENFVAPAGCSLIVNTYEIHRNPKYWEKPNEFYPEHFTPENVAKRHPMAFIPFSAGPRRCIGRHYAVYVLKTLIISTLRSYKIEADGTLQDLNITGDLACRVKDGYKIRIKYRN